MQTTLIEIVFDRGLTEEEFDRLGAWIDENITDDYCAFSRIREIEEGI